MKNSKKNVFKELREDYNKTLTMNGKEMTQTAIAKEMRQDRSHVSKLENGEIQPTLNDYIFYHNKFSVTIEYLLGETTAKEMKNMRLGADLGITDAVAETMFELKRISGEDGNWSAVLNAFIGNGMNTITFINHIYSFLYNEYRYGESAESGALMISNIMNYLNKYVKPQLTGVFELAKQYDEDFSELPIETQYGN